MRKNCHTCNHAGCHKSFTTSSSLTVHKVEKGAAAKAARADDSALCMSEAHLHNIAKEAERRALEAYNALEEGLKMVHATPKEILPGGLLPMSFKIEDGRVPGARGECSQSRECNRGGEGGGCCCEGGCDGGVGAGGRFCASQERGTPAQHLHNMQRPWLRGRAALRPAV